MEEWNRMVSDTLAPDQDVSVAEGCAVTDVNDGMSEEEFRRSLHAKLKSSGVLGTVKGQLRSQLLAQLQRNHIVDLSQQQTQQHPPDLRRRVLNSMLAEYLGAARFDYSLSVFAEESGASSLNALTHEELMGLLRIDEGSALHQALTKSKLARAGQPGSCFLLQLVDAMGEVGSNKGSTSGQPSQGADALSADGDRYQMDVRLQQLESEYAARLRAERMRPVQGVEERMAMYRQEIEEQSRAEVQRQVERVRELEVAAARLEESTKWRRQLEKERQELERIHADKMSKLRSREEETSDRLKRQQREVEAVAFEHRQRILREEERVRAWNAELQSQSTTRQEQLRHLERALELRERAVCSREAAAESKGAEAAEAMAGSHLRARAEVEKEYLELKANLNAQRMQLEMERTRVAQMRSEAAAESGAARSKEDQVRVLEAARAEAEARAAGHAADAEVVRMHAERLQLELSSVRDELSRRVAAAAGAADAMLSNAAGALGMLETEANETRGVGGQLRQTHAALLQEKERCKQEKEAREEAEKDLEEAQAAAGRAEQQVATLTRRLEQTESLVEEAIAARQQALEQLSLSNFQAAQLQRELTEVRASLTRARNELAAQHTQRAPVHSTTTTVPPSPAFSAHTHAPNAARPYGPNSHAIGGSQQHGSFCGPSHDTISTSQNNISTRPSDLGFAHLGQHLGTRTSAPGSMHGSPTRSSFLVAPTQSPWGTYPDLGPVQTPAGSGARPALGAETRNAHTADRRMPDAPPFPAHLSSQQQDSGSGFGFGGGRRGGLLTSPVRERHDAVAKQEAEAAAQLTEYRHRLKAQQEANARDLALARSQALFSISSPTSPTHPTSGAASRKCAHASPYSSPTRTTPLVFSTPPLSPHVHPLPVPLPSALQLHIQPQLRELPLHQGPPSSSFFPSSSHPGGAELSLAQQQQQNPSPYPVPLPSALQSPPHLGRALPFSLGLSDPGAHGSRHLGHTQQQHEQQFHLTQPSPLFSSANDAHRTLVSASSALLAAGSPSSHVSGGVPIASGVPTAGSNGCANAGASIGVSASRDHDSHYPGSHSPSISFGNLKLPPTAQQQPTRLQPQSHHQQSAATPQQPPEAEAAHLHFDPRQPQQLLHQQPAPAPPASSVPPPTPTYQAPSPVPPGSSGAQARHTLLQLSTPPAQPTADATEPMLQHQCQQQSTHAVPPPEPPSSVSAPTPPTIPVLTTSPSPSPPAAPVVGPSQPAAEDSSQPMGSSQQATAPSHQPAVPAEATQPAAPGANSIQPATAPMPPPPGLMLVDSLHKAATPMATQPSREATHRQQYQTPQQPSHTLAADAHTAQHLQQQGAQGVGPLDGSSQRKGDLGHTGKDDSNTQQAAAPPPPPPKPPSAQEVQQAQAAKLRVLQEAQAARLATQRAQEEQKQKEEEEEQIAQKEREEQRQQSQAQHSSSSHGAHQPQGTCTPTSKGSEMGESDTPASVGGSTEGERRWLHEKQRPSARQTSSSSTQASSNEGPGGLEVPQSRSSSSKARSQSRQESYSDDNDLPSGSLDVGSIESESNMVLGFDHDSNSGSVF